MPTIARSTDTAHRRPRPDIVPKERKSVQEVESALQATINEKFYGCLRVTRSQESTEAKTTWFVASQDPGYIFGFKVTLEKDRVEVKHGVNTWSMWAEDYTRVLLAQKLDAKLESDGKIVSESITDELIPWMQKYDLHPQVNDLPEQFRRIAGVH